MRLALMRSVVELLVGGLLAQLASGLAELLPGLGDELGEHLRGRSLGARQQARFVGRLHEPVEQVEVAVARERPVQPGQALPALRGQVPQQPLALRGVGRAHGREVAPEADARARRRRAPRRGRRRARPARCAAPRPTRCRARPRRSAGRCAGDGCSPGPGGHRGCRGRAGRSGRGPGGAAPRRRWPAAPTAAMVGCEPSGSGEGSGGASAGGPSARTSLGVGSGSPAPASRSASTTMSRRPSGAPAMASTSSSRKRAATRSPSSTVTSSSLTSARARPPPSRSTTTLRSLWRRATASSGARRSRPAHGAGQLVGDLAGRGVHLDLGAVHRPTAGAGARHLQRPPTALAALAEPVAQRDVRADEAQIGGVVVGRVEVAVTGLGGGDAVGHPVEVGQDEAGPGRQLHLALGVAAGSFARPALSHPPRPCGCGPGRARRAGAGSRCRRRR